MVLRKDGVVQRLRRRSALGRVTLFPGATTRRRCPRSADVLRVDLLSRFQKRDARRDVTRIIGGHRIFGIIIFLLILIFLLLWRL